jgi:hypothetical protein
MIASRQSPVSKVSFRQGRFSSRCISSVLPVILSELAAGAMIAYQALAEKHAVMRHHLTRSSVYNSVMDALIFAWWVLSDNLQN